MHYEVLAEKRKELLPFLRWLKKIFYLAGGTGLALQLGHRISLDFDFFSPRNFDTSKLFEELKEKLTGYAVIKTQEEKNTLTVLIDKTKITFLRCPYKLVEKPIEDENIKIASAIDIGCMKLSAITGRATNKDYVDLFFILKDISLKDLLVKSKEKMPDLDAELILKSLVYFDDVTEEPLTFMPGKRISFNEVKKELIHRVKEFKTRSLNYENF